MKKKRFIPTESLPIAETGGVFGLPGEAGGTAGLAGSAGNPAGTPDHPSSMAESVTRHALNPIVGDFQFLLCGIDTLDLGLYVKWGTNWDQVRSALDQKKELAQG